jgi:putative hydrolase of the HAD superfamily
MVLSGPPDPVAWAVLRAVSGLDEARLHAAYWEFRHDYDRGALTGRSYWDAVAAHAGVRFDTAQVDALMAADIDLWSQPNLPMVEWAGRLQHAGVRTGILSNIGDAIGVVARDAYGKARSGDLPEDGRSAGNIGGQDSVHRRPRGER